MAKDKRKSPLKIKNSSHTYDSLPKLPTETLENTKDLVRWLWRRWRWSGLIPLGAIIVLSLWLNWKDIQELPGVSTATAWLWRESLPLADPSKFSIVLVQLENDPNGYEAKLIAESLSELAGETIQILRIDRLIAMTDSDSEQALYGGHKQARQLLAQTQTQVLIWGSVLKHEQKAVAKLHWTVNKDLNGIRESNRYPVIASDLDLPPVFWEDLQQVLALLVFSEAAGYENNIGNYLADRLKLFINRVLALMPLLDAKRSWSAHQKAYLQLALGNALYVYGEQAGDSTALTEAIATYSSAIKEITRERVPLDWAVIQNNLGNALNSLGEREFGTETLRAAVVAYHAALEECTREQVPLDWARTQNNLGNAFAKIGGRESNTEVLRAAVAAYRAALGEYTRERVPLNWAATKNNLGNVLWELGRLESGTKSLRSAVAIYRAALQERTRERVPLDWAVTQNNLGNALLSLSHREADTKTLEAAVAAYRAALQERTRERVPLEWAVTQNNLGNALWALGERESSIETLLLAESAYRQALSVFEAMQINFYIDGTRENLGIITNLIAKQKLEK